MSAAAGSRPGPPCGVMGAWLQSFVYVLTFQGLAGGGRGCQACMRAGVGPRNAPNQEHAGPWRRRRPAPLVRTVAFLVSWRRVNSRCRQCNPAAAQQHTWRCVNLRAVGSAASGCLALHSLGVAPCTGE